MEALITSTEFEKFLKREVQIKLNNVPEKLSEAIKYSLFSEGKRIRPMSLLNACALFSQPDRAAYLFAAAIECYHTFTLIHDDLPSMDNDDFRRGKPSSHKAFGEGQAVLAGDALHDLAFDFIIDAIACSKNTVSAIGAAKKFTYYTGADGVIGGQSVDIDESIGNTNEIIEYVYRHKTCDLFCCAMTAGALLGGATDSEVSIIEQFALTYGYIFQITDDMLDDGKDFRTVHACKTKEEIAAELQNFSKKATDILLKLNKNTEYFEKLLLKTLCRTK